jgi:hypothetical protein
MKGIDSMNISKNKIYELIRAINSKPQFAYNIVLCNDKKFILVSSIEKNSLEKIILNYCDFLYMRNRQNLSLENISEIVYHRIIDIKLT